MGLFAAIGRFLSGLFGGPAPRPRDRRFPRRPRRRVSDRGRLRALGLPRMHEPGDVAAWAGISEQELARFSDAFHKVPPPHYHVCQIPKRRGGHRQIAAPKRRLRALQRRIHEQILRPLEVHEAAHGFVPERSTSSNASPHAGRQVVIKFDLTDFFHSITWRRVAGVLMAAGYSWRAGGLLARLCCYRPGGATEGPRSPVLPQGAPTSPALSNLVCRRLDARLTGAAARFGADYTRYADDLTFSGDDELLGHIGRLMRLVRYIIRDEGFRPAETKTRVLRRSMRQMVTGLVVNNTPTIPRRLRRRMRAMIHRLERTGSFDLPPGVSDRDPHAWLAGMLTYLQSVNPHHANPLIRAYNRAIVAPDA